MPYVKKVYDPVKCANCGKTFIPKREWQVYCCTTCWSHGRATLVASAKELLNENIALKDRMTGMECVIYDLREEIKRLKSFHVATRVPTAPVKFRYDDEDQSKTWVEE